MNPKGPASSTELREQIDEAVDRWIGKGLVKASKFAGRPLLETPLPSGNGIWFDEAAVVRVLVFFQELKQTIGKWAGVEFTLLDYQVRWLIGPIFGLKHLNGLRVIRTAWDEIPRKNGKSTLCSGLALYLLTADREPGAEVYAAAGDKPQAGIVFRAAAKMAAGSAKIRDRLGKKGIQRNLLEDPVLGSIFRALSADGDRQHGLNVHGGLIDEVHVHKDPGLIDALETGTGSRDQPLIVFITTANDGAEDSIYATKREYLEGLVAGTITDPTFYGVVFGVDENVAGFDPFSEATLRAANPGIEITVTLEYLLKAAAEAQQSPKQLNRYLRLHLNIRTKQLTRWLTLSHWDAAAGLQDEKAWRGGIAYAGLDLSTTTDLTSIELVLPGPTGIQGGCQVHSMFWLPEERAELLEREYRIPFSRWAREGFIRLTEGNVVDYAAVRADFKAEIDRLGCSVASIGFDPWNSTETVQRLTEDGFNLVPCRQGYGTLSGPAKQLERLVLGSTPENPLLIHGGHPILRWNADCVEIRSDDNGNIKPVKPDRMRSTKRIDGIVALIMALREAMAATPEQSAAGDYLAALVASKATAS